MNNIAEGFGRYSNKEFIRFLEYSAASSMEIRSMLYILSDRKYIDEIEFEKCYQLSIEHTNITLGLIRYLKTKL
jgi:four helix bundle protein